MKCLFVHDLRSYYCNGIEYTTNFSYDIIRTRYLSHFDEIRIVNRTKKVDKPLQGKYVISNGDGVFFVNKIDMFSGVDFFLKKNKYKKIIECEVRKADFVIVRLDSFLGLIALKYCRKYSKKYLIEVAGCVWDSFWNKGVSGKILAPFLLKEMKKEIRIAPNVIYVTTEFLQNRYPTRGKNIPCSNVMLDENDYDNLIAKRKCYIESKSSNDRIKVATIAAVDVPYKNQDAVIRALSILKKEGSTNFIYQIVGGGSPERLEKLAQELDVSDQVKFLGSIDHSEIFKILDQTDIYIQPSKQEGLPRALIEGMSRGCTCFGSRVAGIPELLQSDYIFEIKTAAREIANMMKRFNSNIAISQAIRNINESKKYASDILEARRYEFLEEAINKR